MDQTYLLIYYHLKAVLNSLAGKISKFRKSAEVLSSKKSLFFLTLISIVIPSKVL